MATVPQLNRRWADLLVEELVRSGVGLFCLAPGSRSTPLATAVAANPRAKHLVHFDERGTAFTALGYARATGRPAAWITTSGTALANGMPAVVEASIDGVPLVLLTADRPPELRETGANQTIRQPGLFGGYVRWHFDLPAPTDAIGPAFVLTTADQAVHRATSRPRGPVHLNCMFREPLSDDPAEPAAPAGDSSLVAWRASEAPYTRYSAPEAVSREGIRPLVERVQRAERGVVVAGRLATRAEGEAAVRLADALGWPLLPDIGSQVRFDRSPVACAFYDHVLSSAGFREAHRPDAVLYLGSRSTSKRLGQHLAAAQPGLYAVVRDDPSRFDPDHIVTDRIVADVASFCDAVTESARDTQERKSWVEAWRAASDAVGQAFETYFSSDYSQLNEPATARLAAHSSQSGLVLAASMPVRDADAFASAGEAAPRVASNRGASGIDGTVATAAGFARGLGARVTLLIGDLALLHDLNSLALLRDGPPVTIVAVNNDGGGIFHFLPIAEHESVFESYFGTPHGLGFEHAAQMFGLAYHRPETQAELQAALDGAQASGTSSLIEVRTDREANRSLHADLLRLAADAVEATFAPTTP